MLTIHKYPLPARLSDTFTMALPRGARILSVQVQGDRIVAWAIVDPGAELRAEPWRCCGTGHPIDPDDLCDFAHVATVQAGRFVWHFFRDKAAVLDGQS